MTAAVGRWLGCVNVAEALKVLRLPINEMGRDFVLGDIHGAYDLVIQGMRKVGFDRKVDRMFVVGDLIDRGAGSPRVVEFLAQPYVYAVRGNHDHDFLTLDDEGVSVLAGINFNGLGWAKDVPAERLAEIRGALVSLPVAIEVQTVRGTVGMVHADVPAGMEWGTFMDLLERGDEPVTQIALESRERVKGRNEDGVQGVGRLFVGHTVQWEGPRRLGNVYAIDTGAVFRELGKEKGALTMANLAFKTGVLTPSNGEAVLALEEVSDKPFGDYARPRNS